MAERKLDLNHIVEDLAQLNERANLESLPEVKAMRKVVLRKPNFAADSIARLCVVAGLNDYQETISPNPDKESYWGRFVTWVVTDGQAVPPWRRFPKSKASRFDTFRNSYLWNAKLLDMDSGQLRERLAEVMRQRSLDKTICYAPLVLARWAHVLERPFTVVFDHPLPKDSRILRLLERNPGFEQQITQVIQRANEIRRTLGQRDLDMSDFDAWFWQLGAS